MRKFMMLLAVLSTTAYALPDFEQQEIQQRIKPVGQVRVQGKSQQVVAAVAEPEPVKLAPGEGVYKQYCAVCHQGGLAGAPKFQDKADWKPRLANKNLDQLTASAIKGINAMPARGTCGDCTDEQIKEAVAYMLPKE